VQVSSTAGGVLEPENALIPDGKLMAGEITSRLMKFGTAFRWLMDKRLASVPAAMFAQLYHWRNSLFVQQGSLDDLSSLTLVEKQATLYVAFLWTCNVDWCFQFLEGIGAMAALCQVCVEIWACGTMNPLLRHYSLRLVSGFCQVQPIYATIMADEGRAKMVSNAIRLTFSSWDVRALRHVLRIVVAALAFALKVPVLPRNCMLTVQDHLGKPDGSELHDLWKAGAPKRANRGDHHLFRPEFLEQLMFGANIQTVTAKRRVMLIHVFGLYGSR
jgi:hypothetical protein